MLGRHTQCTQSEMHALVHDPEFLHADGITIAWIPLDLHHSRDSSPCDLGLDLLTWSE